MSSSAGLRVGSAKRLISQVNSKLSLARSHAFMGNKHRRFSVRTSQRLAKNAGGIVGDDVEQGSGHRVQAKTQTQMVLRQRTPRAPNTLNAASGAQRASLATLSTAAVKRDTRDTPDAQITQIKHALQLDDAPLFRSYSSFPFDSRERAAIVEATQIYARDLKTFCIKSLGAWKDTRIMSVSPEWYFYAEKDPPQQASDAAAWGSEVERVLVSLGGESPESQDIEKWARAHDVRSGECAFVRRAVTEDWREWFVTEREWIHYRPIKLRDVYAGKNEVEISRDSVPATKVAQNARLLALLVQSLAKHDRDPAHYRILTLDDASANTSLVLANAGFARAQVDVPNPAERIDQTNCVHSRASLFEFLRDCEWPSERARPDLLLARKGKGKGNARLVGTSASARERASKGEESKGKRVRARGSKESYALAFFDYCCTFGGSKEGTRPLADILLLFARNLLVRDGGIFACTFCLRASGKHLTKADDIYNQIWATAARFGYDLETVRALIYGGNQAVAKNADGTSGGAPKCSAQMLYIVFESHPLQSASSDSRAHSGHARSAPVSQFEPPRFNPPASSS